MLAATVISRIAVAARSGADDHAGNGGTAMRGSAKDLPQNFKYPVLRTNDVIVTKMFRATGKSDYEGTGDAENCTSPSVVSTLRFDANAPRQARKPVRASARRERTTVGVDSPLSPKRQYLWPALRGLRL